MYIVYIYMYLKKQNTPFSVQHKNANHEFFTIICFGNKKKQKKHEKRTQSLFGIRQVLPMRQVSWAKVSGCFEFRQLTIAAFSLPKGSKVEHSWVLYTLQWGFGVANNKWFWNGPHAVIFFHNHFHTNLQMKLSRAHKMHVSGWELTHTPPHVTFK